MRQQITHVGHGMHTSVRADDPSFFTEVTRSNMYVNDITGGISSSVNNYYDQLWIPPDFSVTPGYRMTGGYQLAGYMRTLATEAMLFTYEWAFSGDLGGSRCWVECNWSRGTQVGGDLPSTDNFSRCRTDFYSRENDSTVRQVQTGGHGHLLVPLDEDLPNANQAVWFGISVVNASGGAVTVRGQFHLRVSNNTEFRFPYDPQR